MSDLARFQQRLVASQQASQLSPASRYNLAASTLDDDALEQTVAMNGGPAYGSEGFGSASVLQELFSQEPTRIPVSSLKQLQGSLVKTGYASGVEPDGVWSPYWNGAFRRSDRDAMDLVRSGKHWGSVPVRKFFEYLSYSYPPEVFKALHGVATGIWDDAVRTATNPKEVFEEGGLLGGAAAGAGIGAIAGAPFAGIGAVPGAIVGGVIGGVAGFFGDLFDDEDEEEGTWQRIVSSLSPVEEIKSGDAKNLFAALSTILTASAVLKIPAAVARGTGAVIASESSTIAGQTIRQAGFSNAFRIAQRGAVEPGIVSKLALQTLKRPIIGSSVAGGLIDAAPEVLQGDFDKAGKDFVRGAAIGAIAGPIAHRVLPPSVVSAAVKGLEAAPMRRVLEVPALRVARAAFTPFSQAAIAAHIASELPGEQSIEKGMDKAPDFDLPTPLDLTLGAVLYPERLLPFTGRDIGRALKSLDSNHLLLPFAESARTVVENGRTRMLSLREGMERARNFLGRSPDGSYDPALVPIRATFSYLQKGVDDAARAVVRRQSFDVDSPVLSDFTRDAAFREERSKLWKKMFDEARVGGDGPIEPEVLVNSSPTAKKIAGEAMANRISMQNYIQGFEGRGSSLEHFAHHQEATEYLQNRSRFMTAEQGKTVTFVPALKDTGEITGYQTRQDFLRAASGYEKAAQRYKDAFEAARDAPIDSPLVLERTNAGQDMDFFLLDMKRRLMLSDTDYQGLSPINGEPFVSRKVPERMREIAKLRPAEAPALTAQLAENGFDRYIALATDENMLFYDQVPHLLEINGVGEYTRRQGFFDLLSSLSNKVDDIDLGRMRYQSITAELDHVSDELGLPMDGKQMADHIYNELRARYDPRVAASRGEHLSVSAGTIVKRTDTQTQKATRELFKVDPRDLSPKDIMEALNLDEIDGVVDPYDAANMVKRAVHVGSAFGADVMQAPLHPIQQGKAIGRALKLTGLPGFNDFMRTAHLPQVQKMFPENSYGYLPQNLHRASMALRYSLSPTFDAGRYLEQATFGIMKGAIPPAAAFAPRRFLEKREWRSPYTDLKVSGDDAIKHAMRFYDEEILGRNAMQTFDELQMRLLHNGILGFSPRQAEAAQAFFLWNKAAVRGAVGAQEIEKIRETVYELGRYGTGQSAIAKSVHFVFFPYLFQAKQLRAMHDFVLGAPIRNLLVHEGFKRWYGIDSDEALSSSFNVAMEKHFPLAKELQRLNNLSYGIGPGRFFLEGIADKKETGKVAQALTAFFVPGGAHQPLQETAGGVADVLKNLFVPVVMMDEDGTRLTHSEELLDWAEKLVPMYRDMSRWLDEHESPIRAQLTALSEGSAPFAQYRDYLEAKRQMGVVLETAAQGAGFSSWESLANADPHIAAQVEKIEDEVGASYPSGQELAARFTNRDEIKSQVLHDIGRKDDLTSAEEAIEALGLVEERLKDVAGESGRTQDEVLRMAAPFFRQFALSFVNDRQFMNLYEALFESDWGPLRMVA